MKKALFLLIFAILFENVILGPSPMAKRIARVLKIYKEKKIRELQNSDESLSDTETGDDSGTGKVSADAPAYDLPPGDSTSTSPSNYNTNKTSSPSSRSLTFNKFYNYHRDNVRPRLIRYNTLFSFLNIIIARIIKLRLKVFYSVGVLRNLEENAHDESVPSSCTINNTELAGKNGTGANIKYDCEANTTYNASNIETVAVDENGSLNVDNKNYTLDNVTFIGNASSEAANLVSTEGTNVEGEPIEIREAVATAKDNSVVFTGTVKSDEGLSTVKEMFDRKETFTMLLSDYSSGKEIFEEYDCSFTNYNTTNEDLVYIDMSCDTSSKTLKNPSAFNFDDGQSIGDRVIKLHMAESTLSTPINWSDSTDTSGENSTVTDNVNNISYRKNSSGLSGGAIAGIVIACAVVLIAASIVAMMLRKPAPPLDNTTVVGLKTVDNY